MAEQVVARVELVALEVRTDQCIEVLQCQLVVFHGLLLLLGDLFQQSHDLQLAVWQASEKTVWHRMPNW